MKNNTIKRFVAITLLTTMTAGLAGCGATSSNAGKQYVSEEDVATSNTSATTENSEINSDEVAEPSFDIAEIQSNEDLSEDDVHMQNAENMKSQDEEDDTEEADAAGSTDEDDVVRIVFLGDSQFANGRDTNSTIANYVEEMIPNSKVYNLGIGGICASTDSSERWATPEEFTGACFVSIASALAGKTTTSIFNGYPEALEEFERIPDVSAIDYYVIEYGVNDYFTGTQIYDGDEYRNNSAYVNAYRNGLGYISQASPNAKIILSTPCYAEFYNADGVFIGDGNIVDKGAGTLSDYASALQNTASEEGAIYLDAYFGTMMDLTSLTVNDYLMSDGIHLTNRGRKAYATLAANLIKRNLGLIENVDLVEIENIH